MRWSRSTTRPAIGRPAPGWPHSSRALVLTGCSATSQPDPVPSVTADSAARAAAELAAGLAAKDLAPVEFAGATGAEVNQQFQPTVRGLGPLKPQVTVGAVDQQGDNGTAVLNYIWAFPADADLDLRHPGAAGQEAGRWRTSWQPAIVAPELDGSNRLIQSRLAPDRGELLGEDGDPIMTLRPVVRIGIDKSQVSAAQAASVGDPAGQAGQDQRRGLREEGRESRGRRPSSRRSSSGPRRRTGRPTRRCSPSRGAADPVRPDARAQPDFARALIGTVGEATEGDRRGFRGDGRRSATRSGSPGCRSATTRSCAARRASRCSSSPAPPTAVTSPSPRRRRPPPPRPKPVALFEVKPSPESH